MKTIEFEDGYKLSIASDGTVSWEKNGRGNSTHVSLVKEVQVDSEAAVFLRKNNKPTYDYLWAPSGRKSEDTLIRAWNGVREAILEAQAALTA